jgi:hypothetical protein
MQLSAVNKKDKRGNSSKRSARVINDDLEEDLEVEEEELGVRRSKKRAKNVIDDSDS